MGWGVRRWPPGFSGGRSQRPLPRPAPAPRGDGVARRAPRAPHAACERFPAPVAGSALGAVRGRMRQGLGGRLPCRRMLGLGKASLAQPPSPLCFSRIRGSDRLFYRDWSRGLGRARSPGMRCVPRSPPRLCLSPVISVLGRLPQIARQGGHREGQTVSLERGRDSASATWYQLSPVRRKRNCSLTANSGRAGGSEKGRDPQTQMKKIVKVKIINAPGVL